MFIVPMFILFIQSNSYLNERFFLSQLFSLRLLMFTRYTSVITCYLCNNYDFNLGHDNNNSAKDLLKIVILKKIIK